jgi:hypothetical protein
MESDSKRILAVSIYSPKLAAPIFGRRIRLYHAFFAVVYLYQVVWVCSTIGLPYRQFLEKADREGFAGKNTESNRLEYKNITNAKSVQDHCSPLTTDAVK